MTTPDLFDLPASVKHDIEYLDKYELVEDEMTKSYDSFADQNMNLQQENHQCIILIASLQSQIKQFQVQNTSQQQTISHLQHQLQVQQSVFDNKFNEFLRCANEYDQQKKREIHILAQEKALIHKKYTELQTRKINTALSIQMYANWKWVDIYEWIIGINDHRLNKYDSILYNSLKEQNITGTALPSLNDDDLYYLGIKNNLDRSILSDYIHKLCNGVCNSVPITLKSDSSSVTTLKSDSEHKHRSLSVRELKHVRIRQQNIVYVVGLPVSLCNAKLLKSQKWFGKFGEVSRICFNTSPKCVKANSIPTFVTYTNEIDALNAIRKMNLYCLSDGTRLKTNYGRTKYCPQFCEGLQCVNDKCKFLHQWAKYEDIITEQEISDFNAIRAGPPSRFNQ